VSGCCLRVNEPWMKTRRLWIEHITKTNRWPGEWRAPLPLTTMNDEMRLRVSQELIPNQNLLVVLTKQPLTGIPTPISSHLKRYTPNSLDHNLSHYINDDCALYNIQYLLPTILFVHSHGPYHLSINTLPRDVYTLQAPFQALIKHIFVFKNY